MKIIDLLNKIANGEETHFEKKLNGKVVTVNYYNDRDFSSSTDPEMLTIADIIKSLNDEVEIIENEVEILEEEKKIPEKLEEFGIQYNLDYIDYKNIETLKEWLNKDFQTIYDTLDLLIKNQNKIIDYLKSKGE